MIFDRVTNPAGQVDLAMTCRRLLGVASLTTIMVPSTDMHSVGIHPHQKACTGMIDFQERMWPRDSEGRPASSWILCRWCYVLRPRSKEYWYPREKLYEPFRGKVEFDIPSIFRRGVEDWGAPQFANPCPDCAVQFYIPTCDQSRRRFVYQYTNPLPARKSPRSALPVKISEEDLRILGWHWDDDSEQSGGNGDHQASDDTQQAGDM